MNLNNSTQPAGRRLKGFTLIELLIVISIIALLAGILMPSVTSAIRSGYAAQSEALIKSISTALSGYKQDNMHYPGQHGEGALYSTGSLLLAHALFTNSSNEYPRTSYLAYKSEMLETINSVNDTIADGFPRAMAICYYWSSGAGDGLSQFGYSQNSTYTDSAGGSQTAFETAIKDTRYDGTSSTTPFGDGGFLLIAPGVTRKYFDGPDDKMGWGRDE